MAHDLNTVNGRVAMMYVGETPWHGLGTKLDRPPTSAEALVAAGLDWNVLKTEMQTTDGTPVPGAFALVRSDTGVPLGVVGNQYKPIQNRDAFAFMDCLVGEGIEYHTAGAFGQGERTWMLAKVPGEIRIGKTDDITEQYLLLSKPQNGRGCMTAFFTGIRVVCANTHGAAMEEGKYKAHVRIRHSANAESKIAEAQRTLGLAQTYFTEFEKRANVLAGFRLNAKTTDEYFRMLYPDPEEGEKSPAALTIARATREKLVGKFEKGRGNDLPGIKGTMYAAYNAVTEYVDHDIRTKSSKVRPGITSEERRMDSAWFGNGASLKSAAFQAAYAMATS